MGKIAHIGRRHAEIRGDLPLDGKIQLIAIRPLEILREAEERTSGSEELRRNKRERIRAAYAAAAPGGTSYRWTERRARLTVQLSQRGDTLFKNTATSLLCHVLGCVTGQ